MPLPPLPPDEALALRKAAQRDVARRVRAGLTAERLAAASAAICARLPAVVATLAPVARPLRIGVYAAGPREVDVDPAAAAWLAEGVLVAYPRVLGGGLMAFHAVAEVPHNPTGPFGLREPAATALVAALDLLVVPGLAFDRDGGRLGHGGGYYDRWLAAARRPPATIGVCAVAQLVGAVARGPLDAVVDAVVTEDDVHATDAAASGSRTATRAVDADGNDDV